MIEELTEQLGPDAGELLDERGELGPEGDAFEDLDLNDSNDWHVVP